MADTSISHAFVLPDDNFHSWLAVMRAYTNAFERVAIVRSPRGNDLNRYRNVTAVSAPLTWFQDDPHAHIRRIYPMVVRVDVIEAQTPAQLASILQTRINNNDRYGEKTNDPQHIFDRFILDYPTNYSPMEITRTFRDVGDDGEQHVGVDFRIRSGASVLASADGVVTKQWQGSQSDALRLGNYVQVTSTHSNVTYVVTYGGLRSVSVPLNTRVSLGDEIGIAGSDALTVMVQQPSAGMSGLRLPNLVDPTRMIYVTGLRVRATVENLRVRTLPSTNGEILGKIQPWDLIESFEMPGRTLAKMGKDGNWLRVKMPDGRAGYTAAWFLEATTKSAKQTYLGINPVGVNLDARHPLGTPDASRLGNIGWVRFGYNVSNNRGSEDINAAFNRYAPLLESYKKAGYNVVLATSHQTYGEGKNEFWPWGSMTDEKWAQLTNGLTDMMSRIAQQYAGRGLVDCWQIWNEQDAPIGAQASVSMSPKNYANLLGRSIQAIRAADSSVSVIMGGHTGGPVNGSNYARATLQALPSGVRPDGVAFHPYGRSTNPGIPYGIFGHIDESIQKYGAVMPDKPLWITEWGVLDRGNDNPADIANYALPFIEHLKNRYPGKVATMIWYAWAESMHNGYGLVDTSSNPRPPLTELYLNA